MLDFALFYGCDQPDTELGLPVVRTRPWVDPDFLAVVDPELYLYRGAQAIYTASGPNARREVLHQGYVSGALIPTTSLAVSLGGRSS